uniref:Uncharacterized protein n=1 Tax=Arundo donax TaxID=35708 RepID=A0A0A9I0T7_ARUDO
MLIIREKYGSLLVYSGPPYKQVKATSAFAFHVTAIIQYYTGCSFLFPSKRKICDHKQQTFVYYQFTRNIQYNNKAF